MVRDDDVAADGRRELWGGAWESGLREISNNDLTTDQSRYLPL